MLTESESSWVEGYLIPRYPELVALYIEARSIASSAKVSGKITSDQIHRLVEFASSTRTPLSENVAGMLGELASFGEAQEAVLGLAQAGQLHCRVNALVALDSTTSESLCVSVISRLLMDKSSKVRALAGSKAMSFGIKSLIQNLDKAIKDEKQQKIRADLEWDRDLLRDDYIVKNQGDGRVYVTCRQKGGVISTSFPEAEFESKGRKWIEKQRC